jgi:hypothetical protein
MNDNIHGVFVEADGDYYGPFATLNAANAFACTRVDARVCHLDLHPIESLEVTREEFERDYAKRPQLLDPSTV